MSYLEEQYKTETADTHESKPLSTYGLPKSGPIPVFDPKANELKVATPQQASELAEFGYKIGPEAEYEAQKNGFTGKLGALLTAGGNLGSGGLLNLGLAAAGRRGDLINADEAQKANPAAAGVGMALGLGGSLYGGALSAGATKLGLSGLKGVIAQQATTGIYGAALQGISDQVTQDSIMNHPMTAEQLSASVMTDVAWNAGLNLVTHGLVKSPAAFRSGIGKLGDMAEEYGLIKRNMVKAPVVPGTEPILQGFTTSVENSSKASKVRTDSGEWGYEVKTSANKDTLDLAEDRVSSKVKTTGSTDDYELHGTKSKTTGPGKVAAEIKEDAPSFDSVKDQNIEFGWDGQTKEQKKHLLRGSINVHVANDPLHAKMWGDLPGLETMYQKAVAEGDDALKNEIMREKEFIKKTLGDAYPRAIKDGAMVPGAKDLLDEYAKVSGNVHVGGDPFSFGVKVPKTKGGRTITPKLEESAEDVVSSRIKGKTDGVDETLKATSSKIKANEKSNGRVFDQGDFSTKEAADVASKTKETYRWKVPKAAPTMVEGDLEIPFKGMPETLGMAAVFAPAGKMVLGGMAAAMKTAQVATHLLNKREVIGPAFERFGSALMKSATYPTNMAVRMTRGINKREERSPVVYNTKDYHAAVETVGAIATNPEVVQPYIEKKYPALAEAHPELVAQMTATILRGVNALNQQAIKRPYDPTLQKEDFQPTRSQQVQFMKTWRLMANPMEAIHDADAQTFDTLNEVYPAWTSNARQHLEAQMQNSRRHLSGQPARQISSALGAPVRSIDDAQSLKRLQETAGPAPAKQQGKPSGGGGGSAKVSNQAATRDATSTQLNQLGM